MLLPSGLYPVKIVGSDSVDLPDKSYISIDLIASSPDGGKQAISEKFYTRYEGEERRTSDVLALSEYRLRDLLAAAKRKTASDTNELHGVEMFAFIELVIARNARQPGQRDALGRWLPKILGIKETHNRVRRYVASDELTERT